MKGHAGAHRNMSMVMDAEERFQQDVLLILTPYYLCNEEQLKHVQGFCCKTHIHASEEN